MFRAPRPASLPGFVQVVRDLPASQRQIARHLDISDRTLKRYVATDSAPRAVLLALFWETRWGREAADAEASEFGRVHQAHALGLERRVARQEQQIAQLEQALASGYSAANAPVWLQA